MGARLKSLDILRGFDLWLLFFFGPLIHTLCSITEGPVRDFFFVQCEHVEWSGFTVWDIIMPLFIFMSGITIPFSMAKYREGEKPGWPFWKKLLKRFAILVFLGWIVQGNLLLFDFSQWHPFANTLQAIAVAYFVSAVAYAYGGEKAQIVVGSLFFAGYFAVFAILGQLSPDMNENVAMWVDKALLGSHRDGVIWSDDGSWIFDERYTYTWILSSLNFVVTAILGSLTGHFLRNSKHTPSRKALYLAISGVVLILCGLALGEVFPIIKKIWSSSMTLFSGGICCLLMALSYYIVDVRGRWRGLEWLEFYGKNSILAYCIGEIIRFTSISESLLYGLKPIVLEWYPFIITLANVAILFFILRHLYRQGVFLKV